MLVPKLILRRCMVLGLMLAALVALADGVARQELRRVTSKLAFAVAVDE